MNIELPRTEESLQAAMADLAQARTTGDHADAGAALLQLAYLVKWVRSDNDQPPFPRSHTLALEALQIFRQLGDPRGECSALLAAAPFELMLAGEPEKAYTMLLRALELATACGDEPLRARAIAARARQLGHSDPPQARALTAQALAMFRALGDARGTARCLLSTALQSDDPAEKRAHALEALRIFRQLGANPEAGMALTIALAHIDDPREMAPLEQEILLMLRDAESSGNHALQGRCHDYFAQIAVARGDTQAAARHEQRKEELMAMNKN